MMTAQEIQAQQFHVRFRGFDVEEVDEFLERLAGTVQQLNDEKSRLQGQLEEAEKKLKTYEKQEKAFQKAIISAQGIVDEMREKSKREAETLLAKAKAEAASLEESARLEVSDLEKEVDRLKAMRGGLRAELRTVLEACLAQLDQEGMPLMPSFGAAGRKAAASEELYQRIELPDAPEDNPAATAEEADRPTPPLPDRTLFEMAGEEETAEEPAVPNLDGDLVFTLEDPLDEPEELAPALGISPQAEQDDEDDEDATGNK